jgi:hypothetical protein
MDPGVPAAARMLGLLRYVDGDLDDDATYAAMFREMVPAAGSSVAVTRYRWRGATIPSAWPTANIEQAA